MQKLVNYGKMALVKKIIVSSSNNTYYIQIHHVTQQTMLNQWTYYTIQYLEHNTKSDDTQTYVNGVASEAITLVEKMLLVSDVIIAWLSSNRLRLNPGKTQFI